jgi:hypothetical protein
VCLSTSILTLAFMVPEYPILRTAGSYTAALSTNRLVSARPT